MKSTLFTRRGFALSGLAGLGLSGLSLTAACGNGVGSNGASVIDARVDATLDEMYREYPNTVTLSEKATGMLIMPLVTKVGFGIGGGFGRGALQVDGITVDYYSTTKVSGGLQIGAQQYAHVLFFMTQDALLDFRRSNGWTAGANLEYVISDKGDSISTDTSTLLSPVLAAIFAQAGFRVGATLEGSKYNRIIP